MHFQVEPPRRRAVPTLNYIRRKSFSFAILLTLLTTHSAFGYLIPVRAQSSSLSKSTRSLDAEFINANSEKRANGIDDESFHGRFEVTWTVPLDESMSQTRELKNVIEIRVESNAVILLTESGDGYLLPFRMINDLHWRSVDRMPVGLDGTWEITLSSYSGKSDSSTIGWRHEIVENRLIRPQLRTREYRLELVSGGDPMQVNLTADRLGDQFLKGIMQLSENELQICYAYDPKMPRPTDFSDAERDQVYLYRYKRVTDEQPSSATPPSVPNSPNPFLSTVSGYPSWSAFEGIRWQGDQPWVLVDDQWYELVSFDGIPSAEILSFATNNGWPAKHRFTEDLVQIVRLMGHEIDKQVDLELRDEEGEVIKKSDVKMTEEKLTRVILSATSTAAMSAEDLKSDLGEFKRRLESQFAYLNANNVDHEALFSDLESRIDDDFQSSKFALELSKLMAQFIDGHSRVSNARNTLERGYLPFVVASSSDGFVAVRPGHDSFYDDQYPFVEAIDGLSIEAWLNATEPYIRKGSTQSMLKRGLAQLQYVNQLRIDMDLELRETIAVTLVNKSGKRKTISTTVHPNLPNQVRWPRLLEAGVLDGNIGYLPLHAMDQDAVEQIREWMPQFEETNGLIVDVRGNGGGSRSALFELAGYLMTTTDPPKIGNTAKYRLDPSFDEDHLSSARFLYRLASSEFDERERKAIEEFNQSFVPEWNPPEEEFSEWHYLVLSKREDDVRYHYDRQTVILMDEGCFSATDIFLGALKGLPDVTLMGQPSDGGSARVQMFQLPNSQISIGCASMASFLPSGLLYDKHGVEPDILVSRPPEYYISQEGNDVMLAQAIRFLLKGSEE